MLEGQPITPALTAFDLRGRYIDCFARIEDHFCPILIRLVELELCKKAPYLFGDKFELVRSTVDKDGVWQNPHHVTPLLEGLHQFAKLRGLFCHGIIEERCFGDKPSFTIRGPGQTDWESRRVITIEECEDLLQNLKQLTDKLLKQSAKSWSQPSAN